jgi:prepilin signal peptidase PulO-like enzyme (type II secretory pathway)
MTFVAPVLFGLAFGSFANAAIDRLPRGRALTGRSHCDACGRALGAGELVPLLSYVALRGRCAGCRAPIGARTPIVEATSGAAFAVAFAVLPAMQGLAASALFIACVVATGVALGRRSAA